MGGLLKDFFLMHEIIYANVLFIHIHIEKVNELSWRLIKIKSEPIVNLIQK